MIALLAALRSPAVAALAATALLAGAAGLWLGHALGERRVALCQQRSSEAIATAERASRQRLQTAQTAADAALSTERQRVTAATQTTEELRHALNRITTDRVCLGGAARRLLNQSPGIAGHRLPDHPGAAAAATAAAAAHPGQPADDAADTTEADTADWIARAAGQYEACRARVDAIADWQRGVTDAR